jgi:hypothetical protein
MTKKIIFDIVEYRKKHGHYPPHIHKVLIGGDFSGSGYEHNWNEFLSQCNADDPQAYYDMMKEYTDWTTRNIPPMTKQQQDQYNKDAIAGNLHTDYANDPRWVKARTYAWKFFPVEMMDFSTNNPVS